MVIPDSVSLTTVFRTLLNETHYRNEAVAHVILRTCCDILEVASIIIVLYDTEGMLRDIWKFFAQPSHDKYNKRYNAP